MDGKLIWQTLSLVVVVYALPQLILYLARHLGDRKTFNASDSNVVEDCPLLTASKATTTTHDTAQDDQEASLQGATETICSQDTTEIKRKHEELHFVPPLSDLCPRRSFDVIRSLDLSHNALKQLPETLYQLQHLETLNISHNVFQQFPPVILHFRRLRVLLLSDNQLETVADGLHACSLLEMLDISNNQLRDLPTCIGRLTRLLCLECSGNPWDTVHRDLLSHLYKPRSPKRLSFGPELPARLVKKYRGSQDSGVQGSAESKSIAAEESDTSADTCSPEKSPFLPRTQDHRHSMSAIEQRRAKSGVTAGNQERRAQSVSELERDQALNPMGLCFVLAYLADMFDLDPRFSNEQDDAERLASSVLLCDSTITRSTSDSKTLSDVSPSIMEDSPERREKMLYRRKRILDEIRSTEEAYIGFLQTVVDLYIEPLRDDINSSITKDELRLLFSNFESLCSIHRDVLGPELRTAVESGHDDIGAIFLKHAAYIRMYSPYINNYDNASSELDRLLSKRKRFKQFVMMVQTHVRHTQPDLRFYLIMPVQRIPRYKMLLEDLLKHTPEDHFDYINLIKAVQEIQQRALEMNERKREQENNDKIVDIQSRIRGTFKTPLVQPHRRLLRQSTLRLEKTTKRSTKNKCPVLIETPIEKHFTFFLFNDLLLQCKPVPGDHYDLHRSISLVRQAPASLVRHPWAPSGDNLLLRLVADGEAVYYLSGQAEELVQWARLMNK